MNNAGIAFLVILFATLLFAPRIASKKLLNLPEHTLFRVRLIGVVGMALVALMVTTQARFSPYATPLWTDDWLVKPRQLMSGAIIGLFVALYAERFERKR